MYLCYTQHQKIACDIIDSREDIKSMCKSVHQIYLHKFFQAFQRQENHEYVGASILLSSIVERFERAVKSFLKVAAKLRLVGPTPQRICGGSTTRVSRHGPELMAGVRPQNRPSRRFRPANPRPGAHLGGRTPQPKGLRSFAATTGRMARGKGDGSCAA